VDVPLSNAAADVLRRVYGYDSFRGQQQEIIEHVCAGGDAIALMPTGSGKSLCYQIPALVREGTGVVVSPLIALMQDQVDALNVLGVRAGFLNSSQDPDSRRGVEYAFMDGKLDLLYLAPERLRTESALQLLDRGTISPSTRRTAWPSGGTTSGPTTWACRCCTSGGRGCPGSR
jgi:ATP-dependent DNA helicase RecQ